MNDTSDPRGLATVCDAIVQSQWPCKINVHHDGEVYNLLDRVEGYLSIFPGWDLLNSRDLTITSWAGLDLYALDFSTALGKPTFIRMHSANADGVDIVLPRRRSMMRCVK